MSVVAWDGKSLAADCYAEFGNIEYSRVKVFKLSENLWAGFVGQMNGWAQAKEYLTKGEKPAGKLPDFGGLIVRLVDGTPKLSTIDEDWVECPMDLPYFAIGAGKEFAMGALHHGASAEAAVKAACAHCNVCAGPIDVFNITRSWYEEDGLPF